MQSSLPLLSRSPVGAARWVLPSSPPPPRKPVTSSPSRRPCVWGTAHECVSFYCPASARQPAEPVTPNRRPPPRCLRLVCEEPKGGPPLEITLFRSLSARLPCDGSSLGSGTSVRMRFWGVPARPDPRAAPRHSSGPHTGAAWGICPPAFKPTPFPSGLPPHPEEVRNNLLTCGQPNPALPQEVSNPAPETQLLLLAQTSAAPSGQRERSRGSSGSSGWRRPAARCLSRPGLRRHRANLSRRRGSGTERTARPNTYRGSPARGKRMRDAG